MSQFLGVFLHTFECNSSRADGSVSKQFHRNVQPVKKLFKLFHFTEQDGRQSWKKKKYDWPELLSRYIDFKLIS